MNRKTIVAFVLACSLFFGFLFVLLPLGLFVRSAKARADKTDSEQEARKSLDAFNKEFIDACVRMDHVADAAFWADDGTDLIEGMDPMVGKTKITEWLKSLTPMLAHAKMDYCTIDWQDIRIHGDLVYEWGINRQKIEFPPPQEPFVGAGKILLILKRQLSGSWKVEVESWNSLPDKKSETTK
jgi:ketosteroid isomerase-like protein